MGGWRVGGLVGGPWDGLVGWLVQSVVDVLVDRSVWWLGWSLIDWFGGRVGSS